MGIDVLLPAVGVALAAGVVVTSLVLHVIVGTCAGEVVADLREGSCRPGGAVVAPIAGTGPALLAICTCAVPCADEVLPLLMFAISLARIEVIVPISLRSVVKWFRALASVMSMFASRHALMNSLIAQSS